MAEARFPRWVYDRGSEPDPRFSLANERTFLAWVRTALALIAGGVALEALGLPIQPGLRLAASLVSLGLGFAVPILAWINWGAIERAMREAQPLPASKVALPVGAGVSIVAVLLVLGIILR
jgi:putative membrane protein